MSHIARTTQKLYIVVLSWKLIAKEKLKNFNKNKLEKRNLKFSHSETLSWQDQKSRNKPILTILSSRTLRDDTKFLRCAVLWERALFGRPRRHFWLVWWVSPTKGLCKHTVMNELGMGRTLQKHANEKNPQITSKQRDRWSLWGYEGKLSNYKLSSFAKFKR